MAKVGYIFKANHYDSYEADKEWMLKFGCVQVIEEETDHELREVEKIITSIPEVDAYSRRTGTQMGFCFQLLSPAHQIRLALARRYQGDTKRQAVWQLRCRDGDRRPT